MASNSCCHPIRTMKAGRCCMCSDPGKLFLKHSNFRPAWYCGYECLHTRCDAFRSILLTIPNGTLPSQRMVTVADDNQLGGSDYRHNSTLVTKKVIDILLQPAPGATEADRNSELGQRMYLSGILDGAPDLIPSEVELKAHRQVIIKTIDILRKNYDAVPPDRRSGLLGAWQLLYSAALVGGIDVPAEYGPPAAGAKRTRAEEVAGPPAPAPQLPGPPAVLPPSPQQGGGGLSSAGGAPRSRMANALPGLQTDVARLITSLKNTEAQFPLTAVYKLALDMMRESGDVDDSAKAIGALIRTIIQSNNVAAKDLLYNSKSQWLVPDQNAVDAINRQPVITPSFYPTIEFGYFLLAQAVIEYMFRSLTVEEDRAIRALTDIKLAKNTAANNYTLALGRDVPVDPRDDPVKYAEFNWVQNIVDLVRSIRAEGGGYFVALGDPRIWTMMKAAVKRNVKRWW